MAAVQMLSHEVDLECGHGGVGGGGGHSVPDDDDDSSVCFSDAEDGSCCSQFYSTADGDGSHDDDEEIILEAMESRRVSSVADSDCSVEIMESRVVQIKSCLAKSERDCRICHLSLESTEPESGIAIELGCSCKDDLAVSHKHCAEAWFKIKGNKVCEICNSIARNVVGVNDIESGQQNNEANSTATNTASEPGEVVAGSRRSCPDGRLLNFVLAFMVFAFVLSWLFHFNVHA
ncbi:OLC1v1034982C1 [Oldenlandia corymbosa var. corymbosa]|uniref:OLC1v1034982C1 n=1 Tax=Oldenlandia corymbosa var. corymbosa TaxID=529605 RepID=A0AAV1CV21_OLDCO|nr:OLC1v1034982C1 [Oldenlandia corymbosa var. corymbosa]